MSVVLDFVLPSIAGHGIRKLLNCVYKRKWEDGLEKNTYENGVFPIYLWY